MCKTIPASINYKLNTYTSPAILKSNITILT